MTGTSLYSKTPSVTVLDNRGLSVRDIAYHRRPDTPDTTDERIIRHQYDARGRLTQSAAPRLHDAGRVNFRYITDLAGGVLRTISADAGTTVALGDAAGRPFIAVSNISTTDDGTEDRGQAVTRTWQYEDAPLPGRPLSLTEQSAGEAARITERFVYAGNSDAEKALNLAGLGVSHYDTAGLVQTDSVALTGVPLSVTRRLLKDADNPDTVADWQSDDASAWNDLLAAETFTTLTTADTTGAVLTTTDAKGNLQRVAYDVAGLLSGSWLTLKGGTEQVIVASLTYSAGGQKLQEVHGNGVVTTYTYEAETQRLTGMKTERPAAHAAGARVLQDLRYEYDPVGNVLKVSNDAEETRFWRNQKVVPENTYTYDSLYQLVSATGREMASAGQQGGNLPSPAIPLPADGSAYTNYTRTYTYDDAGNLTQIRHSAPATDNNYTTVITVSDRSNRGVLSTLTENPAGVDALFTAGGQQTQLLPGQNLVWTVRNELLKVTPVVRDGGSDDSESYRYDGGSQRILKVSAQKTGSSTQTQRVLYLPGLELRSTKAGETEKESLQVITAGEAGRAQVRVLHWTAGKPTGISNDQVRYSYDNMTGSSGLELDSDGNIIIMEEYYPYGDMAVWTARSQAEVDYKTVRYSGKERDATGLYYYGYRYCQPWAGRWLSADPAGTVDGLNLFRMCRNNPLTLRDDDGLAPTKEVYAPLRLDEELYHPAEKHAEIFFQATIKPKIVSRFEKDKELALKNIALRSGGMGQELGEKYDVLYQQLKSGTPTFNFTPQSLSNIKGDRLLNTWQVDDKKTGVGYLFKRDLTEMQIYKSGGVIPEEHEKMMSEPEPNIYASGRPKYGSLAIGKTLTGGAPHYGAGTMFLDDGIKGYLTYTAMDSMELLHHSQGGTISNSIAVEENLNPVLSELRQSQFASLLNGQSPSTYIEWQSHTPVLFSDVRSIRANNPEMNRKMIKSFSRFSKKHNMQWLDKTKSGNKLFCTTI